MDIRDMPLEVKCGQVMCAGFDGTEVNDGIRSLIRDYHIGNIILFDRNFESARQLFEMLRELQQLALECNGIPLFVSIDQEGGMVTRLYRDATFFPGAMATAAGAEDVEVYELGRAMGQELYSLGVNFNYAPCCDINNNPQNPVINVRSYGDDPQRVSELAALFATGLQDENVIATAKHFPGHGDTETDSHLGLPVIRHGSDRLDAVELAPFRRLIDDGVKAVMAAHIVFPSYEPEDLPATLSKNILTGLLRKELGFNGIITTDCMEMKAIATHYGTANAAPMALAAGADIILVSHTMQTQIDSRNEILKRIRGGQISESILDAAVTRILEAKRALYANPVWEKSFDGISLNSREHAELAERVSCRSVTLVRESGFLPVVPDRERCMAVVFSARDPLTGVDSLRLRADLGKELADNLGAVVEKLTIDPSEPEIAAAVERARQFEKVIVFTYNAGTFKNQSTLVNALLREGANVMVFAMRSPYDINGFRAAANYAAAYEYTPLSVASVIRVLLGEIKAEGRLPVNLAFNLN